MYKRLIPLALSTSLSEGAGGALEEAADVRDGPDRSMMWRYRDGRMSMRASVSRSNWATA